MNSLDKAGTFRLGTRDVKRLGYGTMQLAGPGVFGPPKDRAAAVAVLRAAVESGVDHIDTGDFYGPHITNQILREALHPYRDDLVIATKVGAKRGPEGSWMSAMSPAELTQAVHDNLRNLGLDVIEAVAAKKPKEVWLNPGAESDALIQKGKELGLNMIVACSIVDLGMTPNQV